GWHGLEVTSELVDRLYAHPHGVAVEGLGPDDAEAAAAVGENEFAVCRAGSQSALARRRGGDLVPIVRTPEAWGLHPRSKEQQFALDLLLDPAVPVVALD